jgi:MFS family permease
MTELENPAEEPQSSSKTSRATWWTLGVLTFVSILDWADRALISAIAEPLRHEFQLSDTELGFSMAFAFGIIRIFIGIPVGRLADTHNRRNLLAAALAIWSTMTIAFGMARNYTQLLLARVLIGAGTTGAYPPTVSIISDLFPLRRRGFAMAIFNTGSVLGFSLGLAVGGMLVELYGWRTAMISFGLFGVVLAVLLFFILKEPLRRDSAGEVITAVEPPPLREVFRFMLAQPSLFHVLMAFILVNIIDAAVSFWSISFYVRSHGMSIGEAGAALGLVWVIGGLAGVLLGGYLLDYLGRRDIRWHCWMLCGVVLLSMPFWLLAYLAPSVTLALTGSFLSTLVFSMWYAPLQTLFTGLAGSQMRAVAYSTVSIFLYVGYALGPIITGFISEQLEPSAGDHSLRYSLVVTCVSLLVWAAWHFYRGAATLKEDYARAASL